MYKEIQHRLKTHLQNVCFQRMKRTGSLFLLVILLSITSCVVTNNLYVNNPFPSGKGNNEGYIGLGTGFEAKMDSVSSLNSDIYYSGNVSLAPVLCAGLQHGIAGKTDVRVAVHLPKIMGGVGIRAGIQHSLFDSSSMVNIALGADLGGVFSKDSIKIFGSKTDVGKDANGALNADFFMPIALRSKNGFMVTLTPRYSFNTFYIRYNQFYRDDEAWSVRYPALSLGLRYRQIYFESTATQYKNKIYPHFGLAYMIK